MKKITVLLIGVGGIGFRHFQSLMNLELHTELLLVDINESALERAKEYEATVKKNNIDVKYYTDISKIPESIDVAIIATSSIVRRNVIESLTEKAKVDYMILEKVLFAKIDDYHAVSLLLKNNNIKAYVNCPRRMYPGYIELKKELSYQKHLNVYITGSAWGLCCNSIHLIDAMDFLCDGDTQVVECFGDMLDEVCIQSKRKNYIEMTGKIAGNIGGKVDFVIECFNDTDVYQEVVIVTSDKMYIINEIEQKLYVFNTENQNRSISTKKFNTKYQSQLTSMIIEELVKKGECSLTSYGRSCDLHIPLLKIFLENYNKSNEEDSDLCPIT